MAQVKTHRRNGSLLSEAAPQPANALLSRGFADHTGIYGTNGDAKMNGDAKQNGGMNDHSTANGYAKTNGHAKLNGATADVDAAEQPQRLIDKELGVRTKPVKLLLLGGPRTGTVSLYAALHLLGYRCYHNADLLLEHEKQAKHMKYWREAIRANFLGEGIPYGRSEFDSFLGEYDALGDMPTSLFVEDLVRAYPDAKVILTNRDPHSWLKSMNSSFFYWLRRPSLKLVGFFDKNYVGGLSETMTMYLNIFSGPNWDDGETVRRKYVEHYEHVRRTVPKDRLLEFNQPYEWKALGDFLDVPVPEGAFPKLNSTDDLNNLFRHRRNKAAASIAKHTLFAGIPLLAATVGYFWYQGWRLVLQPPS